jgi:hypothetical protein
MLEYAGRIQIDAALAQVCLHGPAGGSASAYARHAFIAALAGNLGAGKLLFDGDIPFHRHIILSVSRLVISRRTD